MDTFAIVIVGTIVGGGLTQWGYWLGYRHGRRTALIEAGRWTAEIRPDGTVQRHYRGEVSDG